MMHRIIGIVSTAAAIAAAVGIGVTAARADEPSDARPGMTYESIARLPDFSGWWALDLDPNDVAKSLGIIFRAYTPLLKPEVVERAKKTAPKPSPGCSPMLFTGFNGGFEGSVEFLFTPGRVTITNELGLLRRVFLYQPLPPDTDESEMGTSVGHWEGSTLVVETTGLDHNGTLQAPVKIGRGARVVERISLKDKDTLEIVRQMVAPDALTAPSETTFVYVRDRDHVFHEASHCSQDDRSINRETGKQQFDLTPPADLPPPPH